jgi:hypothetical protein
MWLMDHIENVELGYAFGLSLTRLPLVESANIVCGNALQIDWQEVIAPEKCSFIFGNPPFIGSKLLTVEQKADVQRVFGAKASGVIDYVGCWYRLCVDFCKANRLVKCSLVSTSSIIQGEQVAALWPPLFAEGLKIHFAHRVFEWSSEARGKAHVHCVIIGFALFDIPMKQLFEYPTPRAETKCSTVPRINCYLIDGNDVAIPPRTKPLHAPRPMVNGSIPADGGNLLLSAEERADLIARHPEAALFIREYVGAEGLINGNDRHCLWLVDCSPNVLRSIPDFTERIRRVRECRLQSTKEATKAKAAIASLFTENRQPSSGVYLAFPRTSSETRKYIPIAYLPADVIAANDIQMVPPQMPSSLVSSPPPCTWHGRTQSQDGWNLVTDTRPRSSITTSPGHRRRAKSSGQKSSKPRRRCWMRARNSPRARWQTSTIRSPCRPRWPRPMQRWIWPWTAATARNLSTPTASGWNTSSRSTRSSPHRWHHRQRSRAKQSPDADPVSSPRCPSAEFQNRQGNQEDQKNDTGHGNPHDGPIPTTGLCRFGYSISQITLAGGGG